MARPVLPPAARSWPLIGRDVELRLLSAALDDPDCGGVALAGQAGVGKTRLSREMGEMASLRGLVTVAVRATKSAADVPLVALHPLFAALGIDPATADRPGQSIAEAIEARNEDGRLVLVVDDAQELDDASVVVLDHLVGGGGLFVVVTFRHGEATPRGLHGMWMSEHILRLDVGPLAPADVRALVGAVLGGPVDGATLQALVGHSGGNALFLRELVQGAVESGTLTSQRGIWRLNGSLVASPRLADLIDDRFRELSDPERETLELLALGEPLDLTTLVNLVPLTVVEGLERRGLLDAAVDPGGPSVSLAHPLYGEIVRAHLSKVRRARLCRSLAEVTESIGPLRPGDRLRVALWHVHGGGGSPELLLEGSRMAYRGEDYALAVKLARVVWERWRIVEAAMVLGEALDVHGRFDEVELVLREAYPLATSDSQRADIAAGLASAIFYFPDRAEEADELLSMTAAELTDVTCRRALEAQRADHFLRTGNVARAIEADRVLLTDLADEAFAQASRDIGVALALAGRTSEALVHIDTALEARQDLEEKYQVTAAAVFLVARAVALGEAGRLEEAQSVAEAGYSASVSRHNRHGQAWFSGVLGLTLAARGLLTSADHFFRETATLFQDRGHPSARWGLGGIALAAGQRGDQEAASAAVAELDALGPNSMRMMDIHIERGRAWAALAAGDLVTARATLWDAVALAGEWGQLATQTAALHDLIRIGVGAAAAKRLEELEGLVDGELMRARLAYARAWAGGDSRLANSASECFEQCGALLYAAEASSLEQRLALDAGLRRRASAAAVRSSRLALRCEGAKTPALGVVGPHTDLSTREREVALLAAGGMTSREIAGRLFVSTRTVDNHLQKVYLKLGIGGRNELSEVLGSGSD